MLSKQFKMYSKNVIPQFRHTSILRQKRLILQAFIHKHFKNVVPNFMLHAKDYQCLPDYSHFAKDFAQNTQNLAKENWTVQKVTDHNILWRCLRTSAIMIVTNTIFAIKPVVHKYSIYWKVRLINAT